MDLATEERTTRIQDPYSIHESDCFHRGHCSRVNLQIHQIDEHSELDNTLLRSQSFVRYPVLAIGAAKAFGANVGGRYAQRGDERAGTRRAERRPLADGGSARGDDRRGAGLPRSALSPAAAPSLRPPPRVGRLTNERQLLSDL